MWPQPERRGDEKTLCTHQSSSWLTPWRHPCPLLCATTNAVSPRETSVPGGRLSPQPHWVPVPKSRSPGSLWLPVPLAVQAGSGCRHRSARGPPCPRCPFDSGDTEARGHLGRDRKAARPKPARSWLLTDPSFSTSCPLPPGRAGCGDAKGWLMPPARPSGTHGPSMQ